PSTPLPFKAFAITRIVIGPATPAGKKTFSTLFTSSAVPPVTDEPEENTFPRYSFPPTSTSRSRSLTSAGSPAAGGSVQTRDTRRGFELSATLPTKLLTAPTFERAMFWSKYEIAVPVFRTLLRLIRPQPS